MYTHSEPTGKMLRLVITTIVVINSIFCNAQLTVTSTVMPPYSPKFSDYIQKPGKLNIILIPGAELGSSAVYLEGKLSNIDGDIEICTRPGSKPKTGGILLSNAPRTLTFSEIASIFDDQVLMYKGITRDQVIKQGLPEGLYQFCFKVYNYSTNRLVADEAGCSNTFNIVSYEVPVITNPENNSEISSLGGQNIQFRWIMPTGAPEGTMYTLKILELDRPDRNPDEAFNSTGYPVFFETETNFMFFPYNATNPPLMAGKKYAFRITAHDKASLSADKPSTYFINGGKSEVYSFTYGSLDKKETGGPGIIYFLTPQYNHPDSALYASEKFDLFINWTLNDISNYTQKDPTDPDKYLPYTGPNKDTMIAKSAKFRLDFYNNQQNSGSPIFTTYTQRATYYSAREKFADNFMTKGKSYKVKVSLIDTVTNELLAESEYRAFKYVKGSPKVNREIENCVITGTLKYHFDGEPTTYGIPNTTISISGGYFLKTKDGKEYPVPENVISATTTLTDDKNTIDPGNEGNSSKPMGGSGSVTDKSGKTGTSDNRKTATKNYQSMSLSLANAQINAGIYENLFTTQTDVNGNFTYQYKFYKGTTFGVVDSFYSCNLDNKQLNGVLSYSLRVNVQNPYYYQPEGAYLISKSDSLKMGTVLTTVKGYTLKAFITRGFSKTNISQQLVGKTIYLFRKHWGGQIPTNEGTKNGVTTNFGDMFGYCKLIGEEKTIADVDKDGNNTASVTFKRLVSNVMPDDNYYMLIQGSDVNTAQVIHFNMEPKGPMGYIDTARLIGPPMSNLDINELAGSFVGGYQSIENSIYMSKAVTNADIVGQMNVAINSNTNQTGGQQTMSAPWPGGKTPADMAYVANVGTNYAVQNFNTGSSNSGKSVTSKASVMPNIKVLYNYPILLKDGNYNFKVVTAYRIVTDEYPKSKIKGKLAYTWAGKPGFSRILTNCNISLVECLVTDEPSGTSKAMYKTNMQDNYFARPIKHVIKTIHVSKSDGSFEIEFNNTFFDYGKIYTPVQPDEQGPYTIFSGDFRYGSFYSYNEYSGLKTDKIPYTGPVKKVLRIFIEFRPNNYDGIFLSPENDIVINPLDSVDLGTIYSKIISIETTNTLIGEDNNSPISGAECYLLRTLENCNYPEGEGNMENIHGTLESHPNMPIIDKFETFSDGKFTFRNIMPSNSNAYQYENLYYIKTKDMHGTANYVPVEISQSLYSVSYGDALMVKFNNEYNYTKGDVGNVIKMQMNNPIIKGKVVSDINMTLGLDHVQCTLSFQDPQFPGIYYTAANTSTHDGGYFEMTLNKDFHISDLDLTELIPVLEIKDYNYCYYNETTHTYSESWRKKYALGDFRAGRQIVEENIPLSGKASIKGDIVCKTCNPAKNIKAYLQFVQMANNTEVMKGEMKLFDGSYALPAIPGNHKLIVIPYDPLYFSDTIDVPINNCPGQVNCPPKTLNIEVFERLHRVSFTVYNKGTSVPVKDAFIEICDGQGSALSDASGKVVLQFKNVSVDNLTMKVSGPQGSNYIPKYITFHNPETETIVPISNVYLEKGFALSGKVTLDGQPTSNARVYTDMRFNSGVENYSTESKSIFEATVTPDGTFTFNNLPPEILQAQYPRIALFAVYRLYANATGTVNSNTINATSSENKVEVNSVMNPSSASTVEQQTGNNSYTANYNTYNASNQAPVSTASSTVLGDSKFVTPPFTTQTTLNLTTLQNVRMDNIWGFPFKVYNATPASNNRYIVYGVVSISNFSPGFEILNPENLVFLAGNFYMEEKGNDNGTKVYGPVNDYVEINDLRSFKLKYCKTFNTEFKGPNYEAFKIKKKGTALNVWGAVNGNVHIIDNSFKYPSSYLSFEEENQTNEFYLCNKTGTTTTEKNIEIFASNNPGNGNTTRKFYLRRNNENNLKFRFIGFKATADSRNSYIEGNKIVLDATLEAHMKNANPDSANAQSEGSSTISLRLPQLVLKDNAIEDQNGNTPLVVTLTDGGSVQVGEPWKLEVKNWHISPSEGGLVSNNIILHTGKLDVPFSFFNLRADFAYLDEPVKNNINLGGYPVDWKQTEACFAYNPNCGSDRKGHWQLIMYPPTLGTPVGVVKNLPHLSGQLEIETISLLSNNEDVFTISPNAAQMNLYNNTALFKPTMLYTIGNGFEIVGITSFQIPRVCKSLSATLQYTNTGLHVRPINISFTGLGNIEFKPDQDESQIWAQSWDENNKTFIAYGTVSEPGKLDPINVKLIHKAGVPSTEIVASERKPNQFVRLADKGNSGTSAPKLTEVSVSMKADANDWNNLTFSGNMNGFAGLSGSNRMNFTVFGEIKSTDTLKTQGMTEQNPTSQFNNLDMSYEDGRIVGSFGIDNILGGFKASGTMNILIDKNGWLFYGNATAPNVPLPEPCQADIGLIVGFYNNSIPEEAKAVTLRFAIRKEWPKNFNNSKLVGYFTLAGRGLPIEGLDVDIPLVVATAYAEVPTAGIDGYSYLNLADGFNLGAGIDGKIQVNFGLRSITCTSLYGSAVGCMSGEYNNGGFNACAGLKFKLGIKQEIPLVFDCGGTIFDEYLEKAASFEFSTNPSLKAKFSLDLGNCTLCE